MASRRSIVRARERRAGRPPVDVYLFPAIVGGGIGDIDEVAAAGRALARARVPVRLYRSGGRSLPKGVDGPWDWPRLRRGSRLEPGAPRAVTIAPAWGVVAAPPSPDPLGRAGPWSIEAGEIERAYGSSRTLHISLEEFARTLTTSDETTERLREGGVQSRDLSARLRVARAAGEHRAFRSAYRRFRAFDRPNVLPLFATFRYDRAFAREYPEAVQVGPLWSGRPRGRRAPARARTPRWVWYASPASSEAIAPQVLAGLRAVDRAPFLEVRSPRPWPSVPPGRDWSLGTDVLPAQRWRRTFEQASLRIVTGSRSLLEALELGGPFLYFNGALARGSARRRHRPEKIVELLELIRRAGWPTALRRDLRDFSQGRRVAEIVRRAALREGGWARFPRRPAVRGFAPGYGDAGRLVVRTVRRFAREEPSAEELVRSVRADSHP